MHFIFYIFEGKFYILNMGEDVEKSLYLSYTEILKGLHFIKDAIDFVESRERLLCNSFIRSITSYICFTA